MSDLSPAAILPLPATVPAVRPANWLLRIVRDTLSRTGSKLGLAWIIVAVCGAVLAPFLANSRPLLIKMDGSWSSPLLRGLTPSDVILLVASAAALLAWLLRRCLGRWAWALFALIVLVACVAAPLTVRPPLAQVFDQYRQAQAQGRVERVVWAPIRYSPSDRMRDAFDPNHPPPQAPSASHLLGTEEFGSDACSRMIHACRIALAIGFISTGIALVIGVVIGGLMGYFAGVVDLIGMRLVEVFSAIPTLFLILTFVAFFGRNLYMIMVIIGLTNWPGHARFVRAEFLRLRQQDFVVAARACGLPLHSILFRHMLPNGMAPLLVSASFSVAGAILTEATLSFLGLGLVDEPSWGAMLNQALSASGGFRWWLAIYPGMAIFLTVLAYNLLGEAARDAIDPHSTRVAQL